MARQYSLKTFLRQAPNKLLRQHLKRHRVALDLEWGQLGEKEIEMIRKMLDTAPDDLRASIESEFRTIFTMGDARGTDALRQEGADRHHRVDLAGPFGKMSSDMERAYWTFLNHPKVFRAASDICKAHDLSSWRKLARLPEREPDTSDEACGRLGESLIGYYQKEGRGRHCQVDDYSRGNILYWFCYPEDHAKAPLVYRGKNDLKPRPLRPAFEVIYRYAKDERSLELHSRGRRTAVEQLQNCFCSAILGFDLSQAPDRVPPYELQCLLDRDYPLTITADDPVETVHLCSLTLLCQAQPGRKVILEASGGTDPQGVHDLLDALVAGRKIERRELTVHRADFLLLFRHRSDEGRQERLRFHVTSPDMCSLKGDPEHDVARELLKRWGIDVSGPTGNAAARRRLHIQHRLWRS